MVVHGHEELDLSWVLEYFLDLEWSAFIPQKWVALYSCYHSISVLLLKAKKPVLMLSSPHQSDPWLFVYTFSPQLHIWMKRNASWVHQWICFDSSVCHKCVFDCYSTGSSCYTCSNIVIIENTLCFSSMDINTTWFMTQMKALYQCYFISQLTSCFKCNEFTFDLGKNALAD